ncbi:hypothetical protein LEMLEM_LOCUS25471 [Lemmus lemmus]
MAAGKRLWRALRKRLRIWGMQVIAAVCLPSTLPSSQVPDVCANCPGWRCSL